MKTCTKCSIDKHESEYFIKNKETGLLHAQCKACYKEHRKTYHSTHYREYKAAYLKRAKDRRERLRVEFRENMISYLSGKACEICRENDIRVLEFDHLIRSEKVFEISQAVKLGYNWDEVLTEIKKCRILCANCHKKHTANQLGWYKAGKLEAPTGIEPVYELLQSPA